MRNGFSFIIPARDAGPDLACCIDFIVTETKLYWGIDFEIIIVDGDSTDGSIETALELWNKEISIRVEKQGDIDYKSLARFNMVVCLLPTVTIPDGWIGRVVQSFVDHPEIDVIACPAEDPEWHWVTWIKYHIWFFYAKYFKPQMTWECFVIKRNAEQNAIYMDESCCVVNWSK